MYLLVSGPTVGKAAGGGVLGVPLSLLSPVLRDEHQDALGKFSRDGRLLYSEGCSLPLQPTEVRVECSEKSWSPIPVEVRVARVRTRVVNARVRQEGATPVTLVGVRTWFTHSLLFHLYPLRSL